MRRALILLVAADAAAKFALEKKGQKVLNVKLYETGYKFANRGEGKDGTSGASGTATTRESRRTKKMSTSRPPWTTTRACASCPRKMK